MEKGGGIGACGVEMMQVDYISVENLKYITSYVGTSHSASTLTLAEWPRPVACSRQADRVYRGRDPVGFQTTTRPDRPDHVLFYVNPSALSPSSLPSSLAPLF